MFENIALPKKIWEPEIILGKNQCTKNLKISKNSCETKEKKPYHPGNDQSSTIIN